MIIIKKYISSIITLIILILINYMLSKNLGLSFIELSFPIGFMLTLIIYIFSSKGGITTELLDFRFRRFLEKDSRTNSHIVEFEVNKPFLVSLTYTIIAVISSIMIYWKYF